MEKKNFRDNKKGYTLVEVVTVLVIIAIVAGAAVFGITSYQKYANFRKNNEYAKTVFTAAQSALTHYKASGELEELSAKLAEDKGAGHTVPAGIAPDYDGRLSFMMIQGGTVSGEGELLHDLLDDYITDAKIWEASICLEFDPLDGVAYSVCYSDKAGFFTYYGEEGTVQNGVMNIADRSDATRRDICLGYYQAGLSDRSPSANGKTSIDKVELVNGETLDLRWSLDLKYKSITEKLKYTVRLYDEDNKLQIAFTVDGSDFHPQGDSGNGNTTVTALVYTYTGKESNPTETELGEFTFRAYKNSSQVLYLTLDGLDLKAQEDMNQTALADTYSALRLGLDATKKYYAKVQASGKNYKASGWAVSNQELLLFGGVSNAGVYTIRNTRHLYNIRFMEKSAADGKGDAHQYLQEGRADWAGADGIIAHGKAYEGGTVITNAGGADAQAREFPTMKQLNESSIYQAKAADNEDYAIANMTFRAVSGTAVSGTAASETVASETAAKAQEEEGLGLFRTNKGSISNVTLENIRVDAGDGSYVGTLCGKNEGSLEKITTRGGKVSGAGNVGGIAGADIRAAGSGADTSQTKYDTLKNGAEVYGTGENIGGVIGALSGQNQNQTVTLQNSSNTGAVYAAGDRSSNIGGIVGKAEYAELAKCTSSPQYTKAMIEERSEKPLGVNVGGIAGSIQDTVLSDCVTDGGYVFGDTEVGGIVGALVKQGNSPQDALNGSGSYNAAYVLGNTDVGGIVGRNTGEIKNWTNTGIVTAKKSYGGGITGYNARDGKNIGTVTDCISNVDISSVRGDDLLDAARKRGSTGDYIGGLVGRNDGIVQAEKLLNREVVSVVAGKNYVGGIVGCNGTEGELKGYGLGGGYLSGTCFVGGICGLNLSEKLFASALTSKPNKIEGDYYVGGIAGGNMIAASKDLTLTCNVNNFLGNIEAREAFAGGYFGYNFNFAPDADASVIEFVTAAMTEVSDDAADFADRMAGLQDPANQAAVNKTRLIIQGNGNTTDSRLAKISGGLYVGGIVGHSASQTTLTIQNIVNKTPVYASKAAENAVYDREGETGKSYSYAGGIIGYAGQNVIVDTCSNAQSGTVVTAGTYTGGLVEVNEGIVRSCTSNSLGAGGTSYVGGIAGVNGSTGTIENCTAAGDITGGSNVGGIVSQNFGGSIKNVTVTGIVRGSGSNIGGVAGYSYNALNESGKGIQGATLAGNITGSGSNVGGFVGYNEGTLSDLKMNTDPKMNTTLAVTGNANVGGFVGYMAGGNLMGRVNTAAVTAQTGDAGGIAGVIKSRDTTIRGCSNKGIVQAVKSGNAGGITADNAGQIIRGGNSGKVSANNGIVGGIAAVNSQKVQGVMTQKEDGRLTLTGKTYAGGIVGENHGSIEGCTSIKLDIQNKTVSKDSAIGAIVGYNAEYASVTQPTVEDARIQVYSTGCSAGGVAGSNAGSIDNPGVSGKQAEPVTAAVSFADSSGSVSGGNLGGIVGLNTGTVSRMEFAGSVKGRAGVANGYGGIAGVNQGTIMSCKASAKASEQQLVTASGTGNGIPNVGGIAGRNESSAVITTATVGKGRLEVSGQGNLGGISGYNAGTILDCKHTGTRESKETVKISAEQGQVGGLIGLNGEGGLIHDCSTGGNWTVTQEEKLLDAAVGGIIGFNSSGRNLANLENNADVYQEGKDSDSAGGIIGRMEVQSSSVWVLEKCENHGTISGVSRIGGIIGQWKYSGGTLEGCTNDGAVTAKKKGNQDDGIAGGIVGRLYEIASGSKLYLNDCINEGTITTGKLKHCGGILGYSKATAKDFIVTLSECVNAGDLTNGGGGIVDDPETGNYVFLRCRNYGRSIDTNASMSGILTKNGGAVTTMKDCLGVEVMDIPLTQQKLSQDSSANYYIANQKLDENTLLFSQITTPVQKDETEKNKRALVDGDKSSDAGRWQYDWTKDTVEIEQETVGSDNYWKKSKTIEIDFRDVQKLSELAIYWYPNESQTRTYEYRLWYVDEKGNQMPISATNVQTGDKDITVGTITDTANKTAYFAQYDKAKISATSPAQAVTYTLDQSVQAKGIRIEIVKVINDVSEKLNDPKVKPVRYASIYEVECNGAENSAQDINTQSQGTALLYGEKSEPSKSYYAAELNGEAYIDGLGISPADYKGKTSSAVYEDVDPNVLRYYANRYGDQELASPSDLALSEEDGSCKLTWTENPQAWYMDVNVYIYNNDSPGNSHGNGCTDHKNITVYQGNAASFTIEEDWKGKYMDISVQAVSRNALKSSAIVWWEKQLVPEVFPTPQVHLQLVDHETGDTTDKIYRIMVDHPEAYEGYADSKITVWIGGKEYTVSVDGTGADGQPVIVPGEDDGNHPEILMSIQASAQKDGKAVSSRKLTYQTAVYSYQNMQKKWSTSAQSNCGFTGTTVDELAYQQMLKTNAGTQYARTEILTYDAAVGADVVMNSAVTALAQNVTGRTLLANLAPEIRENVLAKPEAVTVRSYPWQAKNYLVSYGSIVAENLTAEQVKENERGYVSTAADGTITVNPGYVIERTGDKQYQVIYTPLLKDENYQNNQISETKLQKPLKTTDIPVLEDYQKEGQKYTFTWDKKITSEEIKEQNISYHVTLTGYKKTAEEGGVREESVQLKSEAGLADTKWTVDGSGWRYNRLELKVSRVGTVDEKTGLTTLLGLSASRSYAIRLPLETVAAPRCELIHKDDLKYTVSWTGIQDPIESEELAGYTVWGNDGEESVKLAGTKSTDAPPDQAVVDLDAYEGQTVTLSVTANVTEDAKLYIDSGEGTGLEVQVSKRLPQPELTGAAFDDAYLEDGYVTTEQFTATGMKLTLGGQQAGIYVIYAAIYDSDAADENGAPTGTLLAPLTGDGGEVMAATEDGPSYTVRPDSREYAANYLFVRFKATDSNQISSKWTKYLCLRLPRVRLDTAAPETGTMENEWQTGAEESLYTINDTLTWAEAAADPEKTGYDIHMKTAGTDGLKLAAGSDYAIKLRKTADESAQPYFTAEIPNLAKENDTDPDTLQLALAQDLAYDSDTYDLYTADLADLSWHLTGIYEDGTAYTSSVCARIQALMDRATGDVIYRLALPDTNAGEASAERLVYTEDAEFISQIDIRRIPADETLYQAAQRIRWYRETDTDGNSSIKLKEVEDTEP